MSTTIPSPMQEDIRCCVCGNSVPEAFRTVYTKEKFAVVKCDSCGFMFIPPFFRRHITYEQYKNEAVTEAVRSGNNWVKVQRHLLRFRFIKKYVPSGRLFDLGAGWGHFLLAARQLGYDIYGIEIAEQPWRYCVNDLGLPVDHIDFFSMDTAKRFDIITMWDVLEHIDRADAFIAKCAEHTVPGGYLFLQVPQIDSFIAKREKDNWKMMGLDHVNYFSKATITKLLDRFGYDVLEIRSSFEIKLFIMYTILPVVKRLRRRKHSATTSQISAADRQQYFNRFTSRPAWQLKAMVALHNVLYNTLSRLRIGEEMMVAARKRPE